MAAQPAGHVDLSDLIDLHVHTSPDIRSRTCDDVEAARAAKEAGMRALLIKSHVTLTADRATLAEKAVVGVRVFGSLTLNAAVGGINPAAVEAALRMGAKVIWMPTLDAANALRKKGGVGGISIFWSGGHELLREVFVVIELIHEADAILATGHLSIEETLALVRAARSRGVRNIVVTHPEASMIRMPWETQADIAGPDLFFERCYVDTIAMEGRALSIAEMVSIIRRIGIDSTILSTDLGLAGYPPPVEGMRQYLQALGEQGFARHELRRMAGETPARLLNF